MVAVCVQLVYVFLLKALQHLAEPMGRASWAGVMAGVRVLAGVGVDQK